MKDFDSKQALRQIVAMAELDDVAIRELSAVAQLERHPAGTILFSEGETHDQIYFICEGAIALNMVTTNCGQQTILSAGSGDLLAWSALVGDQIMTSTAVVASDARMIVFHAKILEELFERNHELGFRMMRIIAKALSRRLLATRLQLLDLFHS